MDYEKLEQLKRLHDSGALNDEEFEKEKKKILDEEATAKPTAVLPMGLTENAYLALMNFAMFRADFCCLFTFRLRVTVLISAKQI